MKNMYLLFVFFFFCHTATAQTEMDTNTIAPIERWSLRTGQKLLSSWNAAGSGVVLRMSTGTRTFRNNQEDPEPIPAVMPVDLEVAYKYHFFEVGLRHAPASLPLGRVGSFFSEGLSESSSDFWPGVAALKSTGWNLGLHFKVKDVPFFVRYGQMYYRSAREVRAVFHIPGDVSLTTWVPNFFLPNDTSIINPNRFNVLTFGIEHGNFWTALDFQTWRIRYPNSFGFNRQRLSFITWTIGAQVGAGSTQTLEHLKAQKRTADHFWMIDISRFGMSVLRANSALAAGFSVQSSWRMASRFRIGLRFFHLTTTSGQDLRKPVFVSSDFGDIPSYHYNRLIARTNFGALQFEYQKPSEKPVQWVLLTGANMYQLISDEPIGAFVIGFPEPPPPTPSNLVGLSAGGGFNYKFLQSRLIFHKPFGRKMMVEWNMGARFGFF